MGEAVGMLEVFGLATAFAAADAGCKAEMYGLRPSIKTNRQMQMNCRTTDRHGQIPRKRIRCCGGA